MEVYKAGNKWVVGLNRNKIDQDPEAVILDQKPIPLIMYKTPIEVQDLQFSQEYWENEYTYYEFSGDIENVCFLKIDYYRREPGYIHGIDERFVTKEEMEKKVVELRSRDSIATYKWDVANCTWIELERLFRYADEFEEEDEL